MRKEVIAHKDPKSPISEIFRTLRTNIQFMNTSKRLKVLQITSTFPGEGKSWVASNLAVTFAQAGKKVILIDADMRKGRQYAIFGVSPRPGLSNYLSGVSESNNENETQDLADYIQETEVPNLFLISAGNMPPNPSELLVSAQMVGLLEELKELCDIVIVDGTPCELVTDSIILARLVDTTVIVTAHKATKKDALERVVRNIQNVGGKIAGVVINKIPVDGKKFSDKYYYYGEVPSNNGNKRTRQTNTYTNHTRPPRGAEERREELRRKVRPENISHMNTITKEPIPTQNPVMNRITESKQDTQSKELKREIQIENKEEITLDKTNDILKQINEYLDQEKTKLKKGNDIQ